jgi:hypothetical protein
MSGSILQTGAANGNSEPQQYGAMKGKVLADGKLNAIYTTNPATGAEVPK